MANASTQAQPSGNKNFYDGNKLSDSFLSFSVENASKVGQKLNEYNIEPKYTDGSGGKKKTKVKVRVYNSSNIIDGTIEQQKNGISTAIFTLYDNLVNKTAVIPKIVGALEVTGAGVNTKILGQDAGILKGFIKTSIDNTMKAPDFFNATKSDDIRSSLLKTSLDTYIKTILKDYGKRKTLLDYLIPTNFITDIKLAASRKIRGKNVSEKDEKFLEILFNNGINNRKFIYKIVDESPDIQLNSLDEFNRIEEYISENSPLPASTASGGGKRKSKVSKKNKK